MSDYLSFLFYQAIVAVNVAIIVNGIIWLSKRKDKLSEKNPNPDFVPPPTTGSNAITPKGYRITQLTEEYPTGTPETIFCNGELYRKSFSALSADGKVETADYALEGKAQKKDAPTKIKMERVYDPLKQQWGYRQVHTCEECIYFKKIDDRYILGKCEFNNSITSICERSCPYSILISKMKED